MGTKPKHFDRLATFTIDEIFSWMLNPNRGQPKAPGGRMWLCGVAIKHKTSRLRTFLKNGTTCAYCSRTATHFALERCKHYPHTEGGWHLNLYTTNPDGSETMMTSDHVTPRSQGGTSNVRNRVCACRKCNGKKADNLPEGRWEPYKETA